MVRVLLVEDDDERATWMYTELPGLDWDRAKNSKVALEKLRQVQQGQRPPPHLVMLDYDIDRKGGGGQKAAAMLINQGYPGAVIIHSANPVGGPQIMITLRQHGFHPVYAPVFHSDSPRVWRNVAAQVRQYVENGSLAF